MKTKLLLLLAAFLFPGSAAQAQGFRVGDSYPISTSLSTPGVVSTQQATINFCAHPASGVPCSNKVNTYTDITLGTACPTSAQIVLAGTTSCVGQTDSRGNWGVNIPAGTFDFTITVGGSSLGPYTVSVGVPPGSNVSVGSLTATGVNGARIVGTAAGQYASIEAALSGLTSGTIIVTDGFSETITTNIVVSGTPGVRIQVMPNASLTIGTGGSITLINNGVWEQPGGIINVTKTSGDAVLLSGGWGKFTLGQLNYTGGTGTTNGVVFAGAEFCDVTFKQITGFGGTALLFGRSGAGATITNRAVVEFINNVGSVVMFASGVSGVDGIGGVPFDEGNRAYLQFASVFTTAGITFGDNGSLHDAQFNEVHGDIHDTSAGGIVPVIFNDALYSTYDGSIFSNHSTLLATFGTTASRNFVRSQNIIPAGLGGPGLSANQSNFNLLVQNLLISTVPPAIASGFGTNPSISSNGTAAFNVAVGSAPGNQGVITLPAAINSWNCQANNLTAAAENRADNTRQIASSQTSATFQNQTTSTGAAVNFSAGDTLRFSCLAW